MRYALHMLGVLIGTAILGWALEGAARRVVALRAPRVGVSAAR